MDLLLGPATVVKAVLLVLACVWCKQVLARLPRDAAELEGQDWPDKVPIMVIWALTAGVMVWMLGTIRVVAANILSVF